MRCSLLHRIMLLTILGFTLVSTAQADQLTFSFTDPIGDQTGAIDVTEMTVVFDNATGDYEIVLKATAANPFVGQFRVNINLFNPDTAPNNSSFQDTVNDFNLAIATAKLVLTGTNVSLLTWNVGDTVATNTEAGLGNPPGGSFFRSTVTNFPIGFLTNEDAIAFGAVGVTTIAVHTCNTTLPFRWPTPSSASQVSQDYAEFNSPGTKRPNHYHTGMDLASPTFGVPQQVFAVAKGEVVAVCPNGVAGGCVFDETVFSTNASNHGFQGVVILEHTVAGSGISYSLYGHLGTVETFLPGQCIEQSTLIGATGGLPDAHLHFEMKSAPVLHNPDVVTGTCIDPGTQNPSDVCFGYTLVNPNIRGYYDAVEYLHLLEKNGFPKGVTLSDAKDNKKTKKINARSGPGAFGNAYPVVGGADEGSYTALSNVPGATADPKCASGWYQIQRASNDCSVIGNCFAPNNKSTKSGVPEAWVCGDFVKE